MGSVRPAGFIACKVLVGLAHVYKTAATPEEAGAAFTEMVSCAAELLADKRVLPGQDLAFDLLEGQEFDPSMTDEVLIHTLITMLVRASTLLPTTSPTPPTRWWWIRFNVGSPSLARSGGTTWWRSPCAGTVRSCMCRCGSP